MQGYWRYFEGNHEKPFGKVGHIVTSIVRIKQSNKWNRKKQNYVNLIPRNAEIILCRKWGIYQSVIRLK